MTLRVSAWPSSPALGLVLAAALTACSGATHETPAPSPTVASASRTEPASARNGQSAAAARPGVHVTAPACGYGGSATAVSIFLDVETDVALTGLSGSFVVTDPGTRARIGVSQAPMMMLVSPVARGLLDFSTAGTTPFGGDLAAGAHTRLQFFAGLAGSTPSSGGPVEIAMTLTAANGQRYEATCTTEGMWPSS